MNHTVGGNKKLLYRKVGKINGGKVESFNRIKDGNMTLGVGEEEIQRTWNNYFEDLYNMDAQEKFPHVWLWWCLE